MHKSTAEWWISNVDVFMYQMENDEPEPDENFEGSQLEKKFHKVYGACEDLMKELRKVK